MANKKTRKLMDKITQQYARDMDRALGTKDEEGFFVSAKDDDGTVVTAIKGRSSTILKLLVIGIIKLVELTEKDEADRDKMMEENIDVLRQAYIVSKAPRKVEA